MARNSTVASRAAHKANVTRAVRKEFINEFGTRTFNALVQIAKTDAGRQVPVRFRSVVSNTSMGAYRANLTRGAYGAYVLVNEDGTWDDDMNLVNV